MALADVSGRLLERGDRAPDFELPDQHGVAVRLSRLLVDGPVVVFFYPAAMTLACTAEACSFRDAGPQFRAAGARRVGVSADPASTQQNFAEQNSLDFTLLTDFDGSVARSYGARKRLRDDKAKRATFVIGADGILRGVVSTQLWMKAHADRALQLLAD